MENRNSEYPQQIPAEKFKLVQQDRHLSDVKLETKRISYFGDVWRRFKRDRSAVVASVLILILLLFSIVVPIFSYTDVSFREENYAFVLPKVSLFNGSGFWDGTKYLDSQYQGSYDYYRALGLESGMDPIVSEVKTDTDADGETRYAFRVDTYYEPGYEVKVLPAQEYESLLAYQQETGIQVFYPIPKTYNINFNGFKKGNIWYKLDVTEVDQEGNLIDYEQNYRDNPLDQNAKKAYQTALENTSGKAVLDENGNLIPNYLRTSEPIDDALPEEKQRYPKDYYPEDAQRIAGDDGTYVYALKVQGGYRVRINIYNDYVKRYNHEPSFVFGTNVYGQDIFACLAYGGRLSFILAISVSLINFIIGACYGSIEGYFGGATDMIMERISDILGYMPFIVVATLFKLHLQEKVGPIWSLLFAFVLTGWIGIAARVRMQFYRFKGHEYVLAARTLGASDRRLIFKHIFPNSLGTIITGSILAIPGVIFSESMLSYLKIIDLETSGLTSIGTMLSNGQPYLSTYPHIILFPALFISILEISFNLFGNGLRDAFNPTLRGAEN